MKIAEWSMNYENKKYKTTIPFSIHSDLQRNGFIEDPFVDRNEDVIQWVDRLNWTYTSKFNVENIVDHKITFMQIDVLAEVYINGIYIDTCNNFHRKHVLTLTKDILKIGENIIKVVFKSTIENGMEQILADKNYPAPNDLSEVGKLNDAKISVFFRKPAYHYGWDWGPRIVSCGIYDDVIVQEGSATNYEYHSVDYKIDYETNSVKVDVTYYFDNLISGDFYLNVNNEKINSTGSEENSASFSFVVDNVELWWCNGLGNATLYDFDLMTDGQKLFSHKIGFREIELVQEKDEYGISFDFYLNKVKIFAKGANKIPTEVLIDKYSFAKVEHEVLSAVESNFNMIRVWGGGIYEPEYFYDLCDENGILVWQDFMFACSMYPGNEEFMYEVNKEVTYVTKRLASRTCLALFCGNNEIVGAWSEGDENSGWGWKQCYTESERASIYDTYNNIFNIIIPKIVESQSKVAYWPSSPYAHSDMLSAHSNSNIGDSHYWGVWHMKEPIGNYETNISRFVSEYGMQSFSSFELLEQYFSADKLFLNSDVAMSHQKGGTNANNLISVYVNDIFDTKDINFEYFCYLSQLNQAISMEKAMFSHRLHKYKCGGSLYWQLNDVWPSASWASIEYDGKWKAAQYYLRNACKNVTIYANNKNKEVDFYILNDLNISSTIDIKIEYKLLNSDIIYCDNFSCSIEANKNIFVTKVPIYKFPKAGYFLVQYTNNNITNNQIIFTNKFSEINFEKPTFEIEVLPDGTYITSNVVTPFCEIILEDRCEKLINNFFHMEKNVGYKITSSTTSKIKKIRSLVHVQGDR